MKLIFSKQEEFFPNLMTIYPFNTQIHFCHVRNFPFKVWPKKKIIFNHKKKIFSAYNFHPEGNHELERHFSFPFLEKFFK